MKALRCNGPPIVVLKCHVIALRCNGLPNSVLRDTVIRPDPSVRLTCPGCPTSRCNPDNGVQITGWLPHWGESCHKEDKAVSLLFCLSLPLVFPFTPPPPPTFLSNKVPGICINLHELNLQHKLKINSFIVVTDNVGCNCWLTFHWSGSSWKGRKFQHLPSSSWKSQSVTTASNHRQHVKSQTLALTRYLTVLWTSRIIKKKRTTSYKYS